MSNATLFSSLSQRLTDRLRYSLSAPWCARHPAPGKNLGEADREVKRILVPLDGTVLAERAIPLALAIAQQCDAVLQLVHVFVPAETLAPFEMLHCSDTALNDKKNRKQAYLLKIARQITATAPVGVSSTVIQGTDVSSALEQYYTGSSDLIVMATHGRGLLGRFWWGSIAHSILQRTTVPLILVPGNRETFDFNPQAIDDVILPISGNKQGEKIVEPLLKLGLFPKARHSLLYVTCSEPVVAKGNEKLRDEEVPSFNREAADMQLLRPVARALSKGNRQWQTKAINSRKPVWHAVSEYANHHSERSLVACTYHRPTLLERVIRPTTPEYLLQTTKSPLMLMPA
jgi:nucleotide-binding universal stress UspA family protein